MTDTIERDTPGASDEGASRRHRDREMVVVEPTEPEPRFGLTYVVSAAARFDPPHEALGDFLTDALNTVDDVDAVLSEIRLVRSGIESSVVRCAQAYRCTVGDERVELEKLDAGTYVPCCDPVSPDAFVSLLELWRRHLTEVPRQLDDVATEAAAAQRRVATMSWLESAVAMAAGNGWSHEASQLDRIFQAIADGAREQVGAMRDAGDSWSKLRDELCRRRKNDGQVDAIVSALDQLLGTT